MGFDPNALETFALLFLGFWVAALALFGFAYLRTGRALRRDATRFLVECRQGHLDWALWLREPGWEDKITPEEAVGSPEWHLHQAEGFELALMAFGAKLPKEEDDGNFQA